MPKLEKGPPEKKKEPSSKRLSKVNREASNRGKEPL
jgi:hypothetical protein